MRHYVGRVEARLLDSSACVVDRLQVPYQLTVGTILSNKYSLLAHYAPLCAIVIVFQIETGTGAT